MQLINYITDFVKSKLSKNQLRDRIRTTIQKLEESVIPALGEVRSQKEFERPKSKYAINMLKMFAILLPSNMRSQGTSVYFRSCERGFSNAVKLLQLLEDAVNKEMPDNLYVDGITYSKATILRLVDVLDFMADYASRQLLYMVAAESNARGLDANSTRPFSKTEEALINANQDGYFKALQMVQADPKEIMRKINALPEQLLTGDQIAASEMAKKDELRLGIIPLVTPAFQFVATAMIDWEAKRYERSRKECKALAHRIELMRQMRNGQLDANAQKLLENMERELVLVRDDIKRMEDRAGVHKYA